MTATSNVKSSGPATADNTAVQNSSTQGILEGAGVGGAGIGIGGTGVGGSGLSDQFLDQSTTQALDQAALALSANEATDNINANTTINFGSFGV